MNDKNNNDRDFHIPPADYSGTFIAPNGQENIPYSKGTVPRENPRSESPQTVIQPSSTQSASRPVPSDAAVLAEQLSSPTFAEPPKTTFAEPSKTTAAELSKPSFSEPSKSTTNAILPPFPEINSHPHRPPAEITPIANQPPFSPENVQTVPTYFPVDPPPPSMTPETSVPTSEPLPHRHTVQQMTPSPERPEKNEHSFGFLNSILSKFGFGHRHGIDSDDLLMLGLILLLSGNNDSSDNSDILLILTLLLLLG